MGFKFIRCDLCKTGLAEYWIGGLACTSDDKPFYYCHDCKESYPPYTHPGFVMFDPYEWDVFYLAKPLDIVY